MNTRLYIIGSNSDDKGTQLEKLTTVILKRQGYTNISTNVIGLGGNEVDVKAIYKHPLGVNMTEFSLLCECKAHNNPINMTDWLKFIGKLSIQRLEDSNTTGLMIALSGANGNVIGSYEELKRYGFINLIVNDDLVKLLSDEFSLCNPIEIENIIYQFTDRRISEISLLYYAEKVYWIISFVDDGFALLSHDSQILKSEDVTTLLPMIYNNTPFFDFIDIMKENAAMIRRLEISKLMLRVLMDSDTLSIDNLWAKTKSLPSCRYDEISEKELLSIISDNQFVTTCTDGYSLSKELDPIEFLKYLLKGPIPTCILSCKLYQEIINDSLLDRICVLQHKLIIPEPDRNKCILILKCSPTALNYAIYEDKAITRTRSIGGIPLNSGVDKAHTQLFIRNLIYAFYSDLENSSLYNLYLDNYNIQSVCVGLGLEIKFADSEMSITDSQTIKLGHLDGDRNKPVIPVVAFSE